MDEQTCRQRLCVGRPVLAADVIAAIVQRPRRAQTPPLPPPLIAETSFVEVAGLPTFPLYADRRATSRPILLIHSINAAASAYEMRPIFERFGGRRTVYALDLPGFGKAARPERTYDAGTYVDAIEAALQHIASPDGVDVVVLSLSSEFAATAALRRPALVRSLTLISPTGFKRVEDTTPKEAAKQRDAAAKVYGVFRTANIGKTLFGVLRTRSSLSFFLGQLFLGPVDAGLIDYNEITTQQKGAYVAPLAFVSGVLFNPEIRQDVYAKLALPVLVLYDKDPFISFDGLRRFADQHPNWTTTRIEPTRGLPQFEKPGEVVAAIEDFTAA